MPISNNAEGFSTSPTTPTTGNTGGGSGDAASAVTQGAASTIRATNASALFGAFGYEFALVDSGSDGACRITWALSSASRVVLSCYYMSSSVGGAIEDVMGIRHASGNMAILSIGTDGKLIPVNSAGSYQSGMRATNALTPDVMYRIELAVTKGTTSSNGVIEYAYFVGNSATPVETYSSNSQNTGTADVAQLWVGRSTGRTIAHTCYYDEIRGNTLASGWHDPIPIAATATQDDPAAVTDSASRTAAASRTIADPAGVADAVTVIRSTVRTIADAAAVTDLPGPQVLDIALDIDDPAGITDSVAQLMAAARTIADAAGITDSVTVVLDRAIAADDPIGVTDSAGTALDAGRSAVDAAGVGDQVSVTLVAARAVGDPIGVTDSVTATLTAAGEVVVSDPAGITDEVTVSITSARGLADAAALTDSVLAILSATAEADDQVATSDSVGAITVAVRTVTDGVAIVDTVTATLIRAELPDTPPGRRLTVEYESRTVSVRPGRR